jgi:hypothetical protein
MSVHLKTLENTTSDDPDTRFLEKYFHIYKQPSLGIGLSELAFEEPVHSNTQYLATYGIG